MTVLGDGTHDFKVGDRVRVLWCYSGHEQHIRAIGHIVGFDPLYLAEDAPVRPGRHIVGAPDSTYVLGQGAYVRFDDTTIQPHAQCLTDDIELALLVTTWDELETQVTELAMKLREILNLQVSNGTYEASHPIHNALVQAENGLDVALELIDDYIRKVPTDERVDLTRTI